MKTVIRHDRAPLSKPKRTPQGFLKASGHFARAGIYEYRNDDGSIRYELRPKEEVLHADSLASYDEASLTVGHPPDEVSAANAKKYEVGHVSGPGRADGDHVAGDVTIRQDAAIKLVEGGVHELSPGYRITLDEKPGNDPTYGYPGNPTGRYHAVQRHIRVNHLAIVPKARGGSTIRLRMDAADKAAASIEGWRFDSSAKMTTVADGHQHAIDFCGWDGMPRQSGCTSNAVSTNEKSEHGHSHEWMRNADGSITISLNEGHTHALLDDSAAANLNPGPRYDSVFDQQRHGHESHRMDKDEQIRSLREQLAAAEAKLGPLIEKAAQGVARADSAEATIHTLRGEMTELRSQIASAATVVETEAVRTQMRRADEAEAELKRREDSIGALIQTRVQLERKAAVVMPDLKMNGMAEREIHATIVKRLDANADISAGVSDAYLQGRFDSLLEQYARTARAHQSIGDVIIRHQQTREDQVEADLDKRRREYRNQGTAPLPNSSRGRA